MFQDLSTFEYRCPGAAYEISRAVHLGRLASFHPACRNCPRRDDTAGLSSRQIRQLAENGSRLAQSPLFTAEGSGNIPIDDLSSKLARRVAVEFARQIRRPTIRDRDSRLRVVVANDGRLATAAIITAVVEGIRWTGSEAIDIGPASAPCTARTIEHLAADGGILVGRADESLHAVRLKFWAECTPLSQGVLLDEISNSLQRQSGEPIIDRPTRTFGPLRRFAARDAYLNDLRPAFHALRPLRFVLVCPVAPVVAYLDELIREMACQIVLSDNRNRLGEQVVATQAHFGIHIGDNGENCHVVDERGQSIHSESLFACVAEFFPGTAMRGGERRQQTFVRMQASQAVVAIDTEGRFWYADGHAPVADALRTLSALLVLLSRTDSAFSEVLDRQAPAA